LADAVKQHQIGQNSVVVPAQPEGKEPLYHPPTGACFARTRRVVLFSCPLG
jgi:hypothetical protein